MLASRVRFVQTEISDPDLPGRRLLTDTLHLEPGRHHGHGGGHPEAGVLAALGGGQVACFYGHGSDGLTGTGNTDPVLRQRRRRL